MSRAEDEILFFHTVDAENVNAQSGNLKEILARWGAEQPAVAFHFRAPDPIVAANPNVRLIKLPPNRLWKAKALAAGLERYSAVVYPTLSAVFDDRVRRMRRALGLGGAVLSTLEGVPVARRNQSSEQDRLSSAVGHKVYCQGIDDDAMRALTRLKSNSDVVIAISPFLRRVGNLIWPDARMTDIPLGVNIDRFNARGRVPHGVNHRIKVVSAGSFQERKRPMLFLELARAHPNVEFIWYGDGALRSQLRSDAANEGLSNLTLPGNVDSDGLADAFRKADIFAFPSVSEGVPKVTQEAAACGLPIVCMEYYEPFSVVHGINGFWAFDDASFTGYVAKLISNSSLRSDMGAAAAKMAENWAWGRLASQWQALITQTALCRAR